jgi:hypothetical protein
MVIGVYMKGVGLRNSYDFVLAFFVQDRKKITSEQVRNEFNTQGGHVGINWGIDAT